MPSSYSASLRLTLQATGEGSNTWGNILNTGVFQLVDTAIAGAYAFALSGSLTLSAVNGSTDQSRVAILNVTSGSGGTVTIPGVSKTYKVRNASSGSVIVTTGSGRTATVAAGNMAFVICDGTNVDRGTAQADVDAALAAAKAYTDAAAFASSSGVLPGQAGNAGKYLQTNGSAATWATALAPANNLSEIVSAATARTNLGVSYGTGAGTVTQGNDSRITGAAQTTGATFSGALFGTLLQGTSLAISAAAGNDRPLSFYTAGANRWNIVVSSAAEGGSNAGSDFTINAYADNGAFLRQALNINRASGAVAVMGSVGITGNLSASGSVTLGASASYLYEAATNTFGVRVNPGAPVYWTFGPTGTFSALNGGGNFSGPMAIAGALTGVTSGAFSGTVTAGAFSGPLSGAITGSTASFSGAVTFSASASFRGGQGSFWFDSSNDADPFYVYNNNGQWQLAHTGDASPLMQAGGGIVLIETKRPAKVASGTAVNSGLISWGTSAPGTLVEGQIYLQVAAV